MYRVLRHWNKSINTPHKWLATQVNVVAPAVRFSSTSAAAAEDKSSIEQLQQIFDEDKKNGAIVPVFKNALLHGNRIAIHDQHGEYSYHQLLEGALKLSKELTNVANQSKVAFLCPNTAVYSVAQWACWISGQVAVPLSSRHPTELIKYYVKDSEAKTIVTMPEYAAKIQPVADELGCNVICLDHTMIPAETELDLNNKYDVVQFNQNLRGTEFYQNANAMILYTSGSTGPPKGAVISHRNIYSQTSCLNSVWNITKQDNVLHVLPLNHVHGCVNALLCPLSVGAKVSMLPKFDPTAVWSKLLNINAPSKDRVTVFMAVPTIYSLLIAEYEKAFGNDERMVGYIREQCQKIVRLMISGSAPLPGTVFAEWERITGHKLLERYGMTETGMILSNPYYLDTARDRIQGTVGHPLPETMVRLVDNNRVVCEVAGEYNKGYWHSGQLESSLQTTSTDATDVKGELYVKGPSVFVGYYKKPEETENAFEDSWFKTGDVAAYENGIFKILGRSNVDIIKTGGYKVSALDIETHLLEHPQISDVCVVGVPDTKWGQTIAALIVLKKGPSDANTNTLTQEQLNEWCKERIASYQTPTTIQILNEIPRNAMGKVNKREIVRDFFQ